MTDFQQYRQGPDDANDPARVTSEQRFELTFFDEGVEHSAEYNQLHGRKWVEPRTGVVRPLKQFWDEAAPLLERWNENVIDLATAWVGTHSDLFHEQLPGTGNELSCGDAWMTLHTFKKLNGTVIVPSLYPFQERMFSQNDEMLTDVIPSGEILKPGHPAGIMRKFYLLYDDYAEPNSIVLPIPTQIKSAGAGARIAMKVEYRFSPEAMPDLLRNLQDACDRELNIGSILRELIVQKATAELRHRLELALRSQEIDPHASVGGRLERQVIDECMSKLIMTGLRDRFSLIGYTRTDKDTAVVDITVPKIPAHCSRDELKNLDASYLHKQHWLCTVKIDHFNKLSVRRKVVGKQ